MSLAFALYWILSAVGLGDHVCPPEVEQMQSKEVQTCQSAEQGTPVVLGPLGLYNGF
jgi:hypothetical protein